MSDKPHLLQDFIYKPSLDSASGEKKVDRFDLNSLYYEPGQKSYMREAIAYQVLKYGTSNHDAFNASSVTVHDRMLQAIQCYSSIRRTL